MGSVVATLLVGCGTCAAAEDDVIGPTPIPFYTGNLSVSLFQNYFGTRKGPPNDLVTDEHLAKLKRIGCFADCDYQSWAVAEPQDGRWDFSPFIENARRLHAAGFKYIPFAWIQYPPTWFAGSPDFVPYECAEHGRKLMQLSPWAPHVWDIHRAFYAAQRQAMGDAIDWIRIATPADYGEVGYPAGMTSWLAPQAHAHAGYWCGDRYARADFRAQMQAQCGTLEALNRRWGTAFAAWDAVDLPALADEEAAATARRTRLPTDRRRWLDFIAWYYGEWSRFVPKLVAVVRESYPRTPCMISLGYASEDTRYGNDYSDIPKIAKHAEVAVQTPGNVAYYAMKRISSACRFYGTRYHTEPPGDVPPDAEMQRLFFDISNGVQVYFEYPDNLDRARGRIRAVKQHLTGARPVVDVAIFNGVIEQRLYGSHGGGFPGLSLHLAELGRDRFDYDVVDEELVRDGALAGYRVLVHVQGEVTEAESLAKLKPWLEAGGTLLTCALDVQTIDGDHSPWRELMPAELPAQATVRPGGVLDWAEVMTTCSRRIGKGLVIRLPAGGDETALLAEATEHVAHHLAEMVPGMRSAALIDGVEDGVLATRLPDRLLYFNPGDAEKVKGVELRAADWVEAGKKPAAMRVELRIPGHGLAAIPLQ